MDFIQNVGNILSFPRIKVIDVLEMIIFAFLVYEVLIWIKRTRAWALLKGIILMLVFILFAWLLQMNTIIWIAEKSVGVAITALVIVFQPEIRKALEQLGEKGFAAGIRPFEIGRNIQEKFSDETLEAIVDASFEMARVKTGALIVIENTILLTEYAETGIELDSKITRQLLINIFEHNTPLHDGAVIISGDRIESATCYLPLTDSIAVSKELGTRHRAAVGISEVSDSLTIVVSEETGSVSVAMKGMLSRNLDAETLRKKLKIIQNKNLPGKQNRRWKGRQKHEKEDNE